jgi:hypothetical protein
VFSDAVQLAVPAARWNSGSSWAENLITLRPIEGLEFVEAALPAVAERQGGPFNRAPLGG